MLPRAVPTCRGGSKAPQDEYLHPKGAAANPPPPFGLNVCLHGSLGRPLKVGPVPGQHVVSGGPMGVPQRRKYMLEYGNVAGGRALQLFFISCIIEEEEQHT